MDKSERKRETEVKGIRPVETVAAWMIANGFATGHGDSLEGLLDELAGQIAEIRAKVYVPGLWRCPKCKFQLMQANLHAHNGAVTVRDTPGDKCPNCEGPLWRVSEREAGNDMVDRCEALMEENRKLREAAPVPSVTEPTVGGRGFYKGEQP